MLLCEYLSLTNELGIEAEMVVLSRLARGFHVRVKGKEACPRASLLHCCVGVGVIGATAHSIYSCLSLL